MRLLTINRLHSNPTVLLQRISGCALLAVIAFTLLACAPTRPPIDTANWLLAPERNGSPRKMQSPLWLKMGAFSVATPFDTKSLVYRVSEQRYEKDFYNAYIASPSNMFSNAARQWLDQSGIFRITVAQGTSFFPFYTLQASIDELYGDYREKPEAVVSVQFFLTVTNPNLTNPLITAKRYTQRVGLANNLPQTLVLGQQQALAAILQELEADLFAASANLPKPISRQ
ncbi:MAG: ABC-type transport auxiliary lipoprotein family protein [Polynucleobacter sp.]|nr:ABC-type transport auxiliary lipoprotein family protein [Polynucleobacter sp.]